MASRCLCCPCMVVMGMLADDWGLVVVGATRAAAWCCCWPVRYGSVCPGEAPEQGHAGAVSLSLQSKHSQHGPARVVQKFPSCSLLLSGWYCKPMIYSCSWAPLLGKWPANYVHIAKSRCQDASCVRACHRCTSLLVVQMSDWERRPLSSKQLEYAALDAFVLLEIYDVISHPNQGLSQAQLGLSMYSYSHQKWRRNSSKGLLPDDVPERQQHAKQLDNEPAVPAILPASLSTARNHSTRLSSTASARSGDGQYATGHAMLHSTAGQQEGREEQLHIDQAVAMTEGSPLQECLQRHGLQTAVRSHPTSGAGGSCTLLICCYVVPAPLCANTIVSSFC